MKDRNGNEVVVGEKVFVLPDPPNGRKGGVGWVRALSKAPMSVRARIDNGNQHERGDDFTWSVWAKPDEMEVLR